MVKCERKKKLVKMYIFCLFVFTFTQPLLFFTLDMEKNGKKYFLQGELGWEKNGLDENLWTKHVYQWDTIQCGEQNWLQK